MKCVAPRKMHQRLKGSASKVDRLPLGRLINLGRPSYQLHPIRSGNNYLAPSTNTYREYQKKKKKKELRIMLPKMPEELQISIMPKTFARLALILAKDN